MCALLLWATFKWNANESRATLRQNSHSHSCSRLKNAGVLAVVHWWWRDIKWDRSIELILTALHNTTQQVLDRCLYYRHCHHYNKTSLTGDFTRTPSTRWMNRTVQTKANKIVAIDRMDGWMNGWMDHNVHRRWIVVDLGSAGRT